jgi:hypothetical protein
MDIWDFKGEGYGVYRISECKMEKRTFQDMRYSGGNRFSSGDCYLSV